MTVSPQTMDTLYRNQIINYIPYDLMNGQGGGVLVYNNPSVQSFQQPYNGPVRYGVSSDAFTPMAPQGSVALNNLGVSVSETEVNEVREHRNSLKKGSENKLNVFKNKKQLIKGLTSITLVLGTLALLLVGCRKKPDVTVKRSKSLLSKLNPFNWFKKKS